MMRKTFLSFMTLAFSLTTFIARAQENHAAYWEKYGGLPPLDIRVTLDGKEVQGLFEAAKATKANPANPPPLKNFLISVRTGQKIKFKVEISPRDAHQWTDASKHPNLLITVPAGRINVDKRTGELWILGDTLRPQLDVGMQTMIFYYSDFNAKDEQGAYTEIYFDIAGKK